MASKVITGKSAQPASKKAAPSKNAGAKPVARKGAVAVSGKKVATASSRPEASDGSITQKFDNILQRMKLRDKDLTAKLNALLADLK